MRKIIGKSFVMPYSLSDQNCMACGINVFSTKLSDVEIIPSTIWSQLSPILKILL